MSLMIFRAGPAVRGSAEPLTVDATFRIASNTKTYVAAAILRPAEMGKLSLDDPLGGYPAADQSQLLTADGYDLDAMTINLGDYPAQGHAGFWNTFVFHVAELAWLLVKAVDGGPERAGRQGGDGAIYGPKNEDIENTQLIEI